MSNYQYEILNADHAEAWRNLRVESARDFPLGVLITYDEALQMTLEKAMNNLCHSGHRGVCDEDRLIGFCGIRISDLERIKHTAEIGPFFVKPDYHGHGAASFLIQSVIEEALSSGIELLELYVDAENHRAIAFYEKLGFQRKASIYDSVRIDGVPRTDYFCQLKLT